MIIKHLKPWLIFLVLALIVLGPLMLPGYILSVDLSWGPHLPTPDWTSNTAPLVVLLRLLQGIFPSWVIEKFMLLSVFTLAGVGMWRLASTRTSGWPAYVSGVLYVLNPFTYERLMAGQWLVLGGYAVLPFVVAAAATLLKRPGLQRTLSLAAWSAILGIISLHALAMAALIVIILVVVHAWGRGRTSFRPALPWLALATVLWVGAAALWFVPLVTARSATSRAVASFDVGQFTAFRTAAGPAGVPLNTLSLQGFWGERTGLLAPASGTGGWFWVATLIIWGGVLYGGYQAVRHRDRLALVLALSALVAWWLGMGVAWGPAAGFTGWLVEHAPFYRGYREPAKWLAVIALTYAYLIALALRPLAEKLAGFWRGAAVISCVLVLYMWVPLMPWGAAGQLLSQDYPAGWYALNARLNRLPPASAPDVLLLPWHQYLYLDFAHRPVALPAAAFFDRSLITSNDPELPGVPPFDTGVVTARVQTDVINRRFFVQNAGSRLEALGVHYVVLLKVSDWRDYGWLSLQSDLLLVADTSEWQLYQTRVAK